MKTALTSIQLIVLKIMLCDDPTKPTISKNYSSLQISHYHLSKARKVFKQNLSDALYLLQSIIPQTQPFIY